MDLRGRGNERIHRVKRLAARLTTGDQPTPFVGDCSIHPYDSRVES